MKDIVKLQLQVSTGELLEALPGPRSTIPPSPLSSTSFKMYIVPCLTLMSSLLLRSLLLLLHFPLSIIIFSLASECLGFRGLGSMVD